MVPTLPKDYCLKEVLLFIVRFLNSANLPGFIWPPTSLEKDSNIRRTSLSSTLATSGKPNGSTHVRNMLPKIDVKQLDSSCTSLVVQGLTSQDSQVWWVSRGRPHQVNFWTSQVSPPAPMFFLGGRTSAGKHQHVFIAHCFPQANPMTHLAELWLIHQQEINWILIAES